MKKSIFYIMALGVALTGCKNGDVDFPDYDYQTIYFARQSPVRTITLGDERYADNTLDNEHAFEIKAVLGGVNENRADHAVNFKIDNSLCDNLYFSDGRKVEAMPESYYTVATDRMVIKKGSVLGGARFDLTDAFFADPKSIDVTYVIPVVLTNSADSILCGKVKDGVVDPNRLRSDDWSVIPQDYVLYAVKYKNQYDGSWLSKGTDKTTHKGSTTTSDRNAEYWEKASVRYLKTRSLTQSVYTHTFSVPTIDAEGNGSEKNISCDLILTIDESGNCSVATDTPDCTASGSGKWERLGEKNAFADEDRDRLELNYTYTINYVVNEQTGETASYTVETNEVMCLRARENTLEEFSFVLK